MRRLAGLPIFWQTLLLLVAALIVTQAVSVSLFLSLKPPRADFNRLSDVADALLGIDRNDPRERALRWRRQAAAPIAEAGMIAEGGFTARLAGRIGVAPDRVRLYFEPDQRGGFPFDMRPGQLVPMRRGEPLFFNRMVAGVRAADGWRVVETPPRPAISGWQRRTILWFMLSALALVPLAWLFARALTRPIRRFADAADRMGADPSAPSVPHEGPAELRVTAAALNRMQARLAGYLAERTAMIGAIAHDLRTPLARIAFRIEAADDPLREKVQGDVEQMRAMIAATIAMVRGSRAGPRVPLDLGALVRRMAAREVELGRPVKVDLAEPATVIADPVAIERLIQNLIDNAIAYGGEAALSVRDARAGAVVQVADRGPGLAAGSIERMMRPFERGEPSRNRKTGGIGLGLTIARGIAEDHGAVLELGPRVDGGLVAEVRWGA